MLVLLCGVAIIAADTLTSIHDGANRRTLDPQILGFTERTGLFAGPDPIPLINLLPDSILDSVASITGIAHAGSELFDPLLNKYEGTNSVNSDHVSELAGIVTVPQIGMTIRGDYRYEDRFSQMFDRFTARHDSLFAPLSHSGNGLVEETGATATYRGRDVRGALNLNSYGRWGVVPGTDSIYHYRQGKVVRGIAELTRGRVVVRGGGGIDEYDEPTLDGTVKTIRLPEGELSGEYAFGTYSVVGGGMTMAEQRGDFGTIYGSYSQIYSRGSWRLKPSYLFDDSDKKPAFGGEIAGRVKLLENLILSGKGIGKTNRDAIHEERYLFKNETIGLQERFRSELNGTVSLTWKSKTPLKLNLIFQGDRFPRYEHTFSAPFTALIVDTVHGRSTAAAGITGSWNLSRPLIQIAMDGMIRADLLDKPSLSTPGFIRSAVTVGKETPRSLRGTITLEERAPVTRVRFDGAGTEQISCTDWSSAVLIDLAIPVESPFLRNRIEPAVVMSAGPFYFSKDQQFEQLPGGNPISPQIRVVLIGKLLVGTVTK